ncbi:unnamed protein product [Cylindrotheca closterium]|uniref:Uncharacterized protein n=1 Tax=Cylindrotheca closterium TaxID=2856 RepID=A0AAD2CDT7_9STRA|nr:unnamed protein product [Cylindrotheca closterium]
MKRMTKNPHYIIIVVLFSSRRYFLDMLYTIYRESMASTRYCHRHCFQIMDHVIYIIGRVAEMKPYILG